MTIDGVGQVADPRYPRAMPAAARSSHTGRRIHLILAASLAVGMLGAAPGTIAAADDPPSAETEPTPEPTPPPVQKVFHYRSAAITRQYTNYWCVPAATQTMWNLIKGISNNTYRRQKSLYRQIREHNRYRYTTKGNDIQGWAWALRKYTGKAYQPRSYTSKSTAIRAIAKAIDRTGHPVGITVHHGTHAWIVLGYKAQPSATDPTKRTILGFYVSGPLGPGSRDPWRYDYISMTSFRRVYGKYHERTRRVIWEDKYVLVSD
jgi:hypothetical protein